MRTAKFAFVAALCVLLGGAIDLTGPIGGGGPGFGITDLVGSASGSPTYYVNQSTGNDSNAGTQASPWATLHKVNNSVFSIIGTTVYLQGTFSGGDNGLIITTTVAPSGGLVINQYGAGATIQSGNSTACATATNVPSVAILNITCTGGGNASNATAGISIVNSQAGNTKLAGPSISGVTVSGYGYNGIEVKGTSGSSGFSGVTIVNSTIHDNTGNFSNETQSGSGCINIFSDPDFSNGITTPAHTNVKISGNTVYNCTGFTAATVYTGIGIGVLQTSGALVTKNIVHDVGVNVTTCGGDAGIWTWDATGIQFTYNEVYRVLEGSGGCDGEGIDIDAGVTKSAAYFNWSHDNVGADYALQATTGNTFSSVTCCSTWGDNTMAFNIGQNSSLNEMFIVIGINTTGPFSVYNNMFYCSGGMTLSTAGCVRQTGNFTYAGTLANNIFLGIPVDLVMQVGTPSSIVFAGNNYYTTTGASADYKWNGTTYTSFAAWQTATSQEKIGGSNVGLTVNPKIYVPGGGFNNAGYVPANLMAYNLQAGSPMIGAGLSLGQFGITPPTTDYYGVTVNPAALPVGAANGDFTTFAASCPAATNYLARVSSFSKLDNVNYNSLLCGENSDGDLPLLDAQYILGAPNHAAAILNLVSSSFGLTEHGTCTFAARIGITGDGSTCYEDTGFKPSTAGGNYVQNAASNGAYDLTAGTATFTSTIGAQNAAATAEATIQPFTAGNVAFFDVNDETGGGFTTTTAKYLAIGIRTSASNIQYWANGVLGTSTSVNSVATIDENFYIIGENLSGTPSNFSPHQISAAFVGGNISPANVSRRINSFEMAYGVNVY